MVSKFKLTSVFWIQIKYAFSMFLDIKHLQITRSYDTTNYF